MHGRTIITRALTARPNRYLFRTASPLTSRSTTTPTSIRTLHTTAANMSSSAPSDHQPSVTAVPDPDTTQPTDSEQPPIELPASGPLPLPAPGEGTTTLAVNGGTVKLDHLGPLVVNQDGTLSRIANWDKMAEIEKRNTLRVLGKRNRERLDALKKAGGAAGEREGKQ